MPYLYQLDERGIALQGWELGKRAKVYGRDEEADVQIDDNSMSRKHFAIEVEEDGYCVHDRDSTNGTFVNGSRVSRTSLKPGDMIRAGHSQFRYDVGMSTMVNQAERDAGRSIQSELKEIYKQYE